MENKLMKKSVKKEIENIYSLFKKTPKLNVKNVKQHIFDFKNKPEHFFSSKFESGITHNIGQTKLKSAINKVIRKKHCTWCAKSAADVQSSLINEWYQEEYKISGYCGSCQDEIFIGAPDLREEIQ
jgi:hypothetical protein